MADRTWVTVFVVKIVVVKSVMIDQWVSLCSLAIVYMSRAQPLLSHAKKESGETRIQFWFPLNVRDVLWRSHNSTICACIIIRVNRAELFASPKLPVHLAKLKRWVASSITCWTTGDRPSLGSFKSLSQSLFQTCPWRRFCSAIWLAASRSCRTEPKLNTRFTRLFFRVR